MTSREALQTYFGYDDFRPLQEEIIDSVLAGKDTLALMPTGGGKSLCFQIPALVQEGLCLVISPLIALMKDQVENLKRRGIQAAAIYTGMNYDRQRAALDNCMYGPYRCLYVSPERLENEEFRQHIAQLPITLIAVDEAHCISQWGYDFRPSYLKIAQIRQSINHQSIIPILALTATATPDVVEDIQERLAFREKNVLKKSFARENLSYVVRYCANEEMKVQQLQHILSRVKGSAIVYVRSRKRAEQLAKILQCGFYHAGLSSEERNRRQDTWKCSETTMVCTNAFGMGVDKPNVRLVIHYDLPDTLEAYFQEAGRAGRDEKQAYAVLLYTPADKVKARKRVYDNYPEKSFVELAYHKTCDYLGVGAGSGLNHSFALHIGDLARVMHLPELPTYAAMRILSQAGYIDFQDEQETQPRVMINMEVTELRGIDLSADLYDLLQRLMRTYPGIFTELQYIHEEMTSTLHNQLVALASRHIITYLPRTVACCFTLVRERQTEIWLSPQVYEKRKGHYQNKLQAMVEYAENLRYCRSQVLLAYFGENNAPACGGCDVCRLMKDAK